MLRRNNPSIFDERAGYQPVLSYLRATLGHIGIVANPNPFLTSVEANVTVEQEVSRLVGKHRAVDVPLIIIGAGQAGLSAAQTVLRKGMRPFEDFIVLDANEGPGGAWRHRWPSLTLGKAHGIHDLPGLELGTPDPLEPASAVVERYYGQYEQRFDLPIARPFKVREVVSTRENDPDAPLLVEAINQNTGDLVTWTTHAIINATGTWDQPFWPYYPGIETFKGKQLHTKDYWDPHDFAGQRVLVVGGGASAVQFLMPLSDAGVETLWSTRRPPVFGARNFNTEWGIDVEKAVRERTEAGLPTISVVEATGLALTPEYQEYIDRGVLSSLGRIKRIHPEGVEFEGVSPDQAIVTMPAWDGGLQHVDVILWATGFKYAMKHLAPLKLRSRQGGIATDGARVFADSRVYLAGYGAGASTIGATRTGRVAGASAVKYVRSLVSN